MKKKFISNNKTIKAFQNNAIKKQQTTKIKGGDGLGAEDGIDV